MVKQDKTSWGELLKTFRKKQRMTQVEMSHQSGLSKSYISFLESNLRHPSRDVVGKLADILALNAAQRDQLLTRAGYAPLSRHSQSTTKSEPENFPQDFAAFMQQVLQLIRQAEHTQAQKAIELGFQRYERPAEMQTLLAHLELSKGNFAHAILSQETALKHAELSESQETDYLLNLGVMHFLQGDDFLFEHSSPVQAEQAYLQALSCYQKGLTQNPQSLYLLDESARVYFNLADLSQDNTQAQRYWTAAHDSFQQVFSHPDHSKLKREERITSAAFWGLSCAKIQRYRDAELILSTLRAATEPHWLIDYVLSCALCLHYQKDPQKPLLTRARHLLLPLLQHSEAARTQAHEDQHKDLLPLQSEIQTHLKENPRA